MQDIITQSNNNVVNENKIS